ncbi:Signal transduction histidine kinase CheA [Chitinispirillum alkaliphilum]|nr:Signal transduction histidine kinase CheA [Chitinispirillum alkaliphilum]
MKFVSIESKLVKSSTFIISIIFMIVISVVLVINLYTARKNLELTETNIINSLMAKGKTLVINNSIAMRGMADDNAITEVRSLVSYTVKDDEDISYGIYMDIDSRPWVYANANNESGEIDGPGILDDTMSIWASMLEIDSYKRLISEDGEEIIEFASPVMIFDEPLGFIRYGLSTANMRRSLEEAKRSSRRFTMLILFALTSLAGMAIYSGYIASKKNAVKITRPIHSLAASAKTISEGNYSIKIKPESNDEVGELAETFDSMRRTIKKFTEGLQDLVDEKMQQVRDIMNNIEQGLFTFNLDGTVNEEYSLSANRILMVDDIASCTLENIFRLDAEQKRLFNEWVQLVKQRHQTQRWNKLVRLSPVQELELKSSEEDDTRFIKVHYQKIFDKNNNLSKIMVLAIDLTENRRIEERMNQERVRHEAEMKTILGIANNPQDEINDFMEDARNRANTLTDKLDEIFDKSGDPTSAEEGVDVKLSREDFNLLYRDLHTIKGNAGSYGFDSITRIAHNAENILEKLFNSSGGAYGYKLLLDLKQGLEEITYGLNQVQEKILLLYGKKDTQLVAVPMHKIRQISVIADKLANSASDSRVSELSNLCETLNYRSLESVVNKFKKTIERVAHALGKEVQFVVNPADLEVPPDVFHNVEESLLHIIRNAVDHGIESIEERTEKGKGPGTVTFNVEFAENNIKIKISDNGKGIDTEKLMNKVTSLGLCDNPQTLSEDEKIAYIFHPGLSTKEEISHISGRGVGMDVVKNNLNKVGGEITVESHVGNGSTFTIIIPR